MAWTFIKEVAEHAQADNGTAAGPTQPSGGSGFVYWQSPAPQTGDLIIMLAQYKGNATLSIINSTQSWTALTQQANGTSSVARLFWCRYDSALGADQGQVTVTSGTAALTPVVHVFRPTSSSNTLTLDGTPATGTFTNASATVTITGPTTTATSTITFAAWCSEDDNTWGTLSGSGWSKTGLTAQWRNLSGTDISLTAAYNIQSSATTLANVSQTQLTLGNDPGIWMVASWKETGASFIAAKPFIKSQAVNRANNY